MVFVSSTLTILHDSADGTGRLSDELNPDRDKPDEDRNHSPNLPGALLTPPFHRTLWQRNFHDRVIHRDDELTATRLYIEQNPPRWSLARQ